MNKALNTVMKMMMIMMVMTISIIYFICALFQDLC